MEPTDLVIPADFKPTDGRFGCGPSKVRQPAVAALAAAAPSLLGTSHRQAPVKGLVRALREGLRAFFALPDDYVVILGNGGASLFWDAAVAGLIERRSAHAVCGEFSRKFADLVQAAPFLDDPVVVESPVGTYPDLGPVDGADTYCLIHCETSTGVAMPLQRPAGDGLVLVDGTSAAAGLPVDPRATDAYYFSPQKGFGSDGGLLVALLSPAALARLGAIRASGRHIPAALDLSALVDNSAKDQTPNTPAIATLYLMARQVEWLNERGGQAWAVQSCAEKAALLYGWAEDRDFTSPFVADPAARSNVVCTIDLAPEVDAGAVTATLRANGIVDTEAYRKLGRNQLRVGVFPAVDIADVQALTACIDFVVAQLT